MIQKRHGVAFVLTICCTVSLLLASCGGIKSSTTGSYVSNATTNLSAIETATATATTNIAGEFVGSDSSKIAWIGLSSNGHRFVAFASDGTSNKMPTFSQWFRGTIQRNTVNTTTNNGDRLTAQMTQDTTTGTITLKDGRTFPFVANAIPANTSGSGLYRSQRTINGEQYQAGWIVAPPNLAGTPGIVGTATLTPGAIGTITPGIAGTPGAPGAGGTTETPGAIGTATLTPGATATVETPGATGTVPASAMQGAGAIINEKTGKIIQVPSLTPQNLAAKQVTIPNLGTFNLRQCIQDQC